MFLEDGSIALRRENEESILFTPSFHFISWILLNLSLMFLIRVVLAEKACIN